MSAHAIQNTSENVPEQYDEPQCNKVDGNTKRSRTKRQRCKNIQSQSPLDNKLPKKRAKQDKPYVGALYDEQTMRTEVAYKVTGGSEAEHWCQLDALKTQFCHYCLQNANCLYFGQFACSLLGRS
eukprot:TRINITY_DN1320_c1_g1_i5.p3 TRINITY_DN1320_c1_g1~~TRINITY_DN1320_c1_g1_i5.p3  ORF type:complete len:125 (+),score=5.78 TRINITY_DN1320_c1_g1_i5:255-629(+)